MNHFKRNLSFILILTLLFSNHLAVFAKAEIFNTTDITIADTKFTDNENYPLLTYPNKYNSSLDLSTIRVNKLTTTYASEDTITLSIKPTNGKLVSNEDKDFVIGAYFTFDSGEVSYSPTYLEFNYLTGEYEGIVSLYFIKGIYSDFPLGNCRVKEVFISESDGYSPIKLASTINNGQMVKANFEVLNTPPTFHGIEDKTIRVGDYFDPREGVYKSDIEIDGPSSYMERFYNDYDVSGEVNVNNPGVYKLTYSGMDLQGAVTTVIRTITVRGNSKPYFEGIKNTTITKGQSFDPLYGIKALDNEDGDLTDKIVVNGFVNTDDVGDYTLSYSITDSDGNTTTAPRIISVISTLKPIISGVDDITIKVGSTFDPKAGITAKDADGNDLTSSISIVGKVDTSKIGKYSLVYSVTDQYKNTSTATRIVSVVSTSKPTISGVSDITINVGSTFDPKEGITAKDAEDGDLTDKIIISGKVDTSTPGVYTLEYSVTDSDENKTTIYRIITVEAKAKEVQVQSIIGNNRYETAVLLSKSQFDSANTVVIANGSSLADGLTVTPLAAYKKAPILLTEVNRLPAETKAEISRLGATNAIIVGGTGVVSTNVAKELYSLGIVNIQRLGGKDRYETSLEIAKYIDKYCYDVSKIVISNGRGEPDALSISSVAGRDRMPILLTPTEGLTYSIYDWLKSESLKTAYIIGGTGVVPDSILYKVNEITSDNILNNRLEGQNRYDTNAQVINRFYDKELDKVYIAKGFVLIDALSAGPIAALNNAPVVLAGNDLSDKQKTVLTERTGNLIIRTGGGIYDKAVNSLKACLK